MINNDEVELGFCRVQLQTQLLFKSRAAIPLSRGFDDRRIVVLHYQPTIAALDDDKSSNVPLQSMLYSVRRREGTHEAGDGSNCHIASRKADVHILDGVGRTL